MCLDNYYVVEQDDEYDDFYTAGGADRAKELAALGQRLEYYPIDDTVSDPYLGELLRAPEFLVFSEFAGLLEEIDVEGVELIPVSVKSEDGFEDYFLVNFTDPLSVFDADNSEYDSITLSIHGIKKLVLDKDALASLPKERLHLFCMKESSGIVIVNEEFKNHITQKFLDKYNMELEGFKFTPVDEYRT